MSFKCLDCKRDTKKIKEYYMVHDRVWKQAVPKGRGMLCIKCLGRRLGRKLTKKDFQRLPINDSPLMDQVPKKLSSIQ
jgi:hypothetical protein